jgi:hypothetical protein
MMGKSSIFLSLLIVSAILSGCASLKAYPERSSDPDAELKAMEKYLQPDAITKYDAANDSDRGGLTKTAWRNEVVNARVRATDLHFNTFQQKLFQEGVGSGIATDWIVLALNAAGSLAGSAANALSATSAGIVGAKSAFDKNAFFDKTMPTLLSSMVAKRKEVLVMIREGLTKDIDEYPLILALNDLDSYYNAGTIPGALTDIAATSGATAKKADTRLENLLIVMPAPADLQDRREKAAAFVKTLATDQNKLDALAKSLGVATGANALVDILTAISKASSTRAFDVIAQKLKILFNKEI